MISITFGLAVFALLAVTALTALYLHPRLPDHQLSKETQDAVKVGVGMVVVLSALVLGLLIASVKNHCDTMNVTHIDQRSELIITSAEIVDTCIWRLPGVPQDAVGQINVTL